MKVLTYTSLFPNAAQPILGVFIYQRMAHFAARSGNSVHVIAPAPYLPSWLPGEQWRKYRDIPNQEQIGGLTVYHPRYLFLPKISMPLHGLLMFLGSVRLARRLHRQHRFDCLDAHFIYPDGFAGVLLGKFLGIPVVVSARGTDMNLYPSFRTVRPQIRWTLEKAAGRIAICQSLKTAMTEAGSADASVRVIGNGVDLSRFFPVDRAEAQRRLGLSGGGRIAVAVGALKPVKGQQFLLAALKEIKDEFPDLRLYLLGEGESRSELERMANALGISDRVFLPGNCPNEKLRDWYSAADISCLMSSREGWPNVLLESLACGTPVVATRVGGIPEVISSPDLGVLVEQNADSVAEGLRGALSRPWNRAGIAEHASGRDWYAVAAEVESYFAEIIARRRA